VPYRTVSQDVAVEPWHAEIEAVFRVDGPRMWRALTAFTGDPDVASDAVAEAFAQALGRRGELRSPSAWIWRTAYLVARGELKSRAGEASTVDVPVEMPEPVRDIVVALKGLSPNQRTAVLLHDYAGRPTREVAGILGVAPATVRVHLLNGRRRLRYLLEDERWDD
jgi:RNA polymerase sigma-70 factor (ECF subfamily)